MQFAQFLEFLNNFKDTENSVMNLSGPDVSVSSVFFICSETDNSRFNGLLYKFFRENKKLFCSSISVSSTDFEELKLKLSSNFLGAQQLFFIKDFQQLKPDIKNKLITYLKNYKHFNKIIIFDFQEEFTDKSFAKNLIKLPIKIGLDFYKQIYSFFYNQNTFNEKFTKKLFNFQDTVELNLACTIMKYQFILGRSWESFFDSWFNKFSTSSNSLFDLSQAFFNKEPKNFFKLWFQFQTEYPEEFWITYWSEQLWQASLFVLRAKKYGLLQAKKESYRLPFSFINKTWRNYSIQSLSNAHNALYQFDHKFKNGGTANNLELWYYKFLLGQF